MVTFMNAIKRTFQRKVVYTYASLFSALAIAVSLSENCDGGEEELEMKMKVKTGMHQRCSYHPVKSAARLMSMIERSSS